MSTDPMQKFGKESMDMAMKAFGVWTKNTQAIASEVAAIADANSTLACEISHDRAVRGKWHVVAWWFLANARDLPFHLHCETTVTFRFSKIEGPGVARLERLKLFAVDGVAPMPPLGEVV